METSVIYRRAVIKALKLARIPHRVNGKMIFVCCPFHKETVGSLAIYTDSKHVPFYCYGCGCHGKWEELAEAIKAGGLDKDWDDPQAFKNLAIEIKDLIEKEPHLPPMARPWIYGAWRTFSQSTLKRARSLWWWDERDKVRRIIWPVWDAEKDLVGWVGRDLDGSSPRKYYNMPHMHALDTLWPWPVHAFPERDLILVEGITDALRLLQEGLPALACLGTGWSSTRTALLGSLGIKRVVLAYDGDAAGEAAAVKTGALLENLFDAENLLVWQWTPGNDPGSAPQDEVDQLKKALNRKPRAGHPWLSLTPAVQPHWVEHLGESNAL